MANWKDHVLAHFASHVLILLVVLVLVLNCALVMGVQIALDFPLESPQEPFAQEGHWELLDIRATDRVNWYLLWQNHQQWRLVITERHFHANRWRTVCDTVLTEQGFEEEFTTSYGRIMVRVHGYAELEHCIWIHNSLFRILRLPGDFVLWNVVLLIFEILGVVMIRKLKGH